MFAKLSAISFFAILLLPCINACKTVSSTKYYTSLTDSQLFSAATNGNKVGGCFISVNTGSGFCDLYVISATVGANKYRGWPRNYQDRGTGCVKAPDFPKKVNICWYTRSEYSNWNIKDRASFCTESGKLNAARQLRHAIKNKQCKLPSTICQPLLPSSWDLSVLVPEAQQGSWKCAHSPGKGSCFVTTATYILKVASKCAKCTSQLSNPAGSAAITALGGVAACSNCASTVADAPKCGNTILGIGSKKKGRSCKLIDGKGCWPYKTDKVALDCGKGKECRFKVSNAKAKVWCCRPRKSCKWYQVRCKLRNAFRCSNSALKKSKDKNGAQVLWE